MELTEILIDKDIKKAIPELTDEEFDQLEKNILKTGELDSPLIIWKGENILLDGHNRCRVLLHHPEIKYTIKGKEFDSKDDAILWVCYNQIGRCNLTPERYEMLVGTAYNMAKKINGGERTGTEHDKTGKFTAVGENNQLRSGIENSTGIPQSHPRSLLAWQSRMRSGGCKKHYTGILGNGVREKTMHSTRHA